MELIMWLAAQRGRAKALATHLAVSSATVSEWANKKKPVPVDRCTPVEKFTSGEVTRPELRVDWQTHWPELAGAEGAPFGHHQASYARAGDKQRPPSRRDRERPGDVFERREPQRFQERPDPRRAPRGRR